MRLDKFHPPIDFPEKLEPLITKSAPFKVLHGGRGSAKSWGIARALLILGARRKLFILCAREIQNSIEESVHKLLETQVELMGLEAQYDVQKTRIIGKNGTEFVFAGLKTNVNKIKSMEGIDIVWIEEADKVSMHSWTVLLPTVRRDAPFGPFGQGSEVWVSYNPDLATDYTHRYWVLSPPEETMVIQMNWRDNPWFPEFLRKQKDAMKKLDLDSYNTVWEGHTRKVLKGAIYAKELLAAINDKRLHPSIKADRTKPMIFSFDLGKRDMCCWWAWQQVGMLHNAVDFYGSTGEGIDHFLDVIEERKYKVGMILLPHDARAGVQSAAFRGNKLNTIEKQVKKIYPGKVRIVANISVASGINSVRALFPRIQINEDTCEQGVAGLQKYKYEVDEETGIRSERPFHGPESNPADAFRMYSVWLKEGELKVDDELDDEGHPPPSKFVDRAHPQSWLAN